MKALELSEELKTLNLQPAGSIELGQLISKMGDRSFGLALCIFAIPSALPIPAPGYSIPLGVLIILIGLQMLFGRQTLWLPQRMLRWRFSSEMAQKSLQALLRVLGFFEKFISPRLMWICSGLGIRLFGILVIGLASLMLIPLPFTNTLPALVIFFLGLAITEDDGLFAMIIASLGALVFAFYYGLLVLGVILGIEGLQYLWAETFK